MYSGITLQSATSHYFGKKFSVPFDVKYLNEENKLEYPYQTSWGLTTRTIGALIMVHSDDNGLVLPPKIASKKAVIIPIGKDEIVLNKAREINEELNKNGIVSFIDDSEKSPGFKFAEHEVNGIPLRIEIGNRDIENNKFIVTRRDDSSKTEIALDNKNAWVSIINEIMDIMQSDMYNKALKRMNEKTYVCHTMEEMEEVMNNHPGFVKAMWCGDMECENKIKDKLSVKSRCIPFTEENLGDTCICCGKQAKHMVYWGKQY